MSDLFAKPASGGMSALGFIGALALGATLACDELAREMSEIAAPNFGENPADVFEGMAENVLGDDVTIVPRDETGVLAFSIGEDGEEIEVDFSDLEEWLDEGVGVIQETVSNGVEFEGKAGDDGWTLQLRSPDGTAVVQAKIDKQGGSLSITDEAREMFVGVGAEAVRLPRWVPVYPGATVHKNIYSYDTGDTSSGGIVLSSKDAAQEIEEWYVEQLREGSYVKVQTSSSREKDDQYRARILADDGDDAGSKLSIVVSRDGDKDSLIMVVYKTKE